MYLLLCSRGDKAVFLKGVREILGISEKTWEDKVFLLVLINTWNRLWKFVFIITTLYICPCFHNRPFQLFATAQKMKFSIKDFFSKCDQILNGKLYFLCIVHCFNIYHDSMVQQKNSQSPPQKSSFKTKVYPPPSWGHIVTQAPRQSIIFMLQLLTLFPFKNI